MNSTHRLTGRTGNSGALLHILLIVLQLGGVLTAAYATDDTVCAEARMEVAQELTLERQAFEAHMCITNGLSHITLDNVQVTVNFTDENGDTVLATSEPNVDVDTTPIPFFIRLDAVENMTIDQETLDFRGTVGASSSADIRWRIIPTRAAVEEPTPNRVCAGGRCVTRRGGALYFYTHWRRSPDRRCFRAICSAGAEF